jgi:hypothetical protein
MTVVVDANVAIKWFVQQQDSNDARRVQAYQGPLIAPALLIAETANGLWRHVVHGDLTASNAKAAVTGLPRWFHELVDDHSLASAALELAIDLNYATYDCFYIALAAQRSAPLVTADKKLINRLAPTPHASNVIHLADWT